ncbi:MAG TPA: hypothetical protein VF950_01305 [Planctomycetota bacterium]
MKFPRALVLAGLAALSACHDDPEIITVVVNVLSQGLSVNAEGGSASSAGGVGGQGGTLLVTAFGPVTAGVAPTPPADPPTPAVPTGFTATLTTGETAATGNLLITTLTTTADATYTATNGDVIVTGTLQGGDNAGGQFNITLSALKGTVYVTGAVRTASVDGTLDGNDAGTITINAARIVVNGTLDASGEANATGGGGDGGVVALNASGGPLVLHAGSIVLSGGGSGTNAGGTGANVNLTSSTSLHALASITTSGGASTDAVATPAGGDAGDLTLTGDASVDLAATLALVGGTATGGGAGASGGDGGDVVTNSLVHVKVFGSIDLRGGAATANAGAIAGGNGGGLRIGQAGGVLSADLGLGSFTTAGGGGGATAGDGGDIFLKSDSGLVTVASDLDARGGPGLGAGPADGGAGGDVQLMNDGAFTSGGGTNIGVHPISLLLEGLIVTSGGAGIGAGDGGVGGPVLIQGGGDLTVTGPVTTSGGATGTGTGGAGGDVTVQTLALAGAAVGDISLTGAIRTTGATSGGAQGGAGGDLDVFTNGEALSIGHIVSSSSITLSGGTGAGGQAGGLGGRLRMITLEGDLTVSGILVSAGGNSDATPGIGGEVELRAGLTGGSFLYAAALTVNGGGSTAALATGVAGARGGRVQLRADSASGFLALTTGASITSNGGASTGVLVGGSGGEIQLSTRDQFLSITATITALGGPALGATGFGGLGGAVEAHSDSDGANGGGDLTLTAGSTINVSGGTGPTAGAARTDGDNNNVTLGNILVMAVIFDADGPLATSGANSATGGIVVNSGTITASGTIGGDIHFDGRDATGVAVTAPVAGSIVPTPAAVGGTDFVGQ